MRAQESAKEPSKSAVFGSSGHGLDHVGVAVRDLETAKKDYRNVLGFTVFAGGKHPNRSRNSGPALESGYLELITFWDRTKAQGAMLAKFLQKQEGAIFIGLDVSTVEDTAKLLRARGVNIKGPEAGSISVAPNSATRDSHGVSLESTLEQYRQPTSRPKVPMRFSLSNIKAQHPNTADARISLNVSMTVRSDSRNYTKQRESRNFLAAIGTNSLSSHAVACLYVS